MLLSGLCKSMNHKLLHAKGKVEETKLEFNKARTNSLQLNATSCNIHGKWYEVSHNSMNKNVKQ